MIFYKDYPRDNGSTDFCDSARMAGVMQVFGWPAFEIKTYSDEFLNPVRCPESDLPIDRCRNPITMSRDQLVPLAAGYAVSKSHKHDLVHILTLLVERKWICPSGDFLTPSQRDHFRICAGAKPTPLGRLWLYLDILWSAYVDPLAEPNQLICMLMIAGPKYVRMWKKCNKKWKWAVRTYWFGWREEDELAEFIIRKLEVI